MELEELKPVIEKCLDGFIPFIVYALPGEHDYHFVASIPDAETGENTFPECGYTGSYATVSLFNHENNYPIAILDSLSKEQLMLLPGDVEGCEEPDVTPISKSTSRILYNAQVHEIVKSLRPGTKVVLSRVIAGQTEDIYVTDVVSEYFEHYPETFRYILFTQETGLWIGATPELLLDYNVNTGRISTMSLAGTRKIDSVHPWDDKNMEEHDIVTDYIKDILSESGVEDIAISTSKALKYGDVEHICEHITGKYDGDPYRLIDSLSPTPAVAGYPLEPALHTIYSLETHQRLCYAGYISIYDHNSGTVKAYVNLRCAHLWPKKEEETQRLSYAVYAGGGITRRSVADEEWEETEEKVKTITSILQHKRKR